MYFRGLLTAKQFTADVCWQSLKLVTERRDLSEGQFQDSAMTVHSVPLYAHTVPDAATDHVPGMYLVLL